MDINSMADSLWVALGLVLIVEGWDLARPRGMAQHGGAAQRATRPSVAPHWRLPSGCWGCDRLHDESDKKKAPTTGAFRFVCRFSDYLASTPLPLFILEEITSIQNQNIAL